MGDHVIWALGLGSVVCFWTRERLTRTTDRGTPRDAEGRRGTPRDADAKDKELETTDTDDRMMVFRTFGFLYLFVQSVGLAGLAHTKRTAYSMLEFCVTIRNGSWSSGNSNKHESKIEPSILL